MNIEIPYWLWIVGIIIFIVLGGIVAVYGLSWLDCQTRTGVKYDVTVIVQAVEQSSRWGEHTNLWVQVYGEQDITYKFIGYHNFTVGKTYHIIFVDEPYLINFIVWWFETRGRVQLIEEVTNV